MNSEDVTIVVDALEKLLSRIDTLPWTSNDGSGKWTCLPHHVWKAWIDEEVTNAENALLIYGDKAMDPEGTTIEDVEAAIEDWSEEVFGTNEP